MGKNLYYCHLWFNFTDEPTTKFIWANEPKELIDEFLEMGFVAFSITDITCKEVDIYDGL